MPSSMSAAVPSIMMSAASAPTVVVAATAASSHMPVTMTMTALYEDDAVTAGENIRLCHWHRQCRQNRCRYKHTRCQPDQKQASHRSLPWLAACSRYRRMV